MKLVNKTTKQGLDCGLILDIFKISKISLYIICALLVNSMDVRQSFCIENNHSPALKIHFKLFIFAQMSWFKCPNDVG